MQVIVKQKENTPCAPFFFKDIYRGKSNVQACNLCREQFSWFLASSPRRVIAELHARAKRAARGRSPIAK